MKRIVTFGPQPIRDRWRKVHVEQQRISETQTEMTSSRVSHAA